MSKPEEHMRSFLRAPGGQTAQGALKFSKLRHPTCLVPLALQGHQVLRGHQEPLARREPQELQALAAYRASLESPRPLRASYGTSCTRLHLPHFHIRT